MLVRDAVVRLQASARGWMAARCVYVYVCVCSCVYICVYWGCMCMSICVSNFPPPIYSTHPFLLHKCQTTAATAARGASPSASKPSEEASSRVGPTPDNAPRPSGSSARGGGFWPKSAGKGSSARGRPCGSRAPTGGGWPGSRSPDGGRRRCGCRRQCGACALVCFVFAMVDIGVDVRVCMRTRTRTSCTQPPAHKPNPQIIQKPQRPPGVEARAGAAGGGTGGEEAGEPDRAAQGAVGGGPCVGFGGFGGIVCKCGVVFLNACMYVCRCMTVGVYRPHKPTQQTQPLR